VIFWWVALTALLLCEGIALGVAYDAAALERIPRGWWTPLLHAAPRAMPIAAAVATAGLLVAGPRIGRQLRKTRPARRGTAALTLAAHLAAYVSLFLCCAPLFDESAPPPRHTGWLVVGCVLLAALTCAAWVGAMVPAGALGPLLRETAPLLFLSAVVGSAAWALGRYTQAWWSVLRVPTLHAATAVLGLWESSAHADLEDVAISAREFRVLVSTECSGYEGIGLVWVFLATYFWLFRRHLRFPQALLLVPLATAAAWCANVVRIALLVTIGAHVSRDIAAGGFHSYAGSLLFCGVALGCVAAGHRLSFFSARTPDTEETGDPEEAAPAEHNPAAPFLVPFLGVVAIGLVTGMLSTSDADRFYGMRLVVGAALLWRYRHEYRTLWPRGTARGAAYPALIGAIVAAAWVSLLAVWAPAEPGHSFSPVQSDLHGVWQGAWHATWLAARCAGAILIAPCVEELAFRGYLTRRLMHGDFPSVPLERLSPFAMLLSSILFAALHRHFIAGLVAGLGFAWAARRRGRLADAVVAHATTNALLVAYALATGAWWVLG
jgi:exosortase E/protease (VPEID-CTERM system)